MLTAAATVLSTSTLTRPPGKEAARSGRGSSSFFWAQVVKVVDHRRFKTTEAKVEPGLFIEVGAGKFNRIRAACRGEAVDRRPSRVAQAHGPGYLVEGLAAASSRVCPGR